jgi:hypothetical protein
MHNINANLGNILYMKETKARQRDRDRIIKEGAEILDIFMQ